MRYPEAAAVTGIAQRQHGLVTAAQLQEIGVSAKSVRRRVAAGALRRVGTRVYAVGGAPCSWEQSALAACLDLGHGAVLSHWSAAMAWRLDVPARSPIHVTVPYARNARRLGRAVVLHRSRSLAARDRTRCGALPATSLQRTLLDLAASADPHALARVVDDVLCRRLISPERLGRALDEHARARGRGGPALRALLAPWVRGDRFESVAEVRFLRTIGAAGLPEPVVQRVVSDGGRFVARTDLAWPDRMVVLEVDGFRWHANPASHSRDTERSNRLAACGWTVLHATPAELDRAPDGVIAALRQHLATGP